MKVAVVLIACLAAQILLGCTQNDPQSHSRFDENAQSDHRELKTQKQFHFLYNPDYSRPDEFPPEIPVAEACTFLAQQKVTGQGCGSMVWEGKSCGLTGSGFGMLRVPWMPTRVECCAYYAIDNNGEHLFRLKLGEQNYQRLTDAEPLLKWSNVHEPDERLNAFLQKLSLVNWKIRLQMLAELKQSLADYDLTCLSASQKNNSRRGLENCLNDSDPLVRALADDLIRMLDGTDEGNRTGQNRAENLSRR